MSDFTGQMAAMIAAARPKQAPSPSSPAIMHGAPIGGKRKEFHAQIKLDPWLKLFGYKTPEEKEKIGSDFRKLRESYKDADWDKIYRTEPAQKTLKAMFKTGYQGVYLDENGMYNLPRMSEEARLMMTEANAPKIAAGAYGNVARENLVDAERRSRGLRKEEIYAEGGKAAENLSSFERREREPSDAEKSLMAAQAEAQRAAALRSTEEANILRSPEERDLKRREAEANIYRLEQEAEVAKSHADVNNSQANLLATGMDKDSADTVQQLTRHYADYEQKWMQVHQHDTFDDWKTAYTRNKELVPQVATYIAGIKTVTNKPTHAEPALRSWIAHVSPEFDRSFRPPTSVAGVRIPYTGQTEDAINHAIMKKQYIIWAKDFIKQSGTKSHDIIGHVGTWLAKMHPNASNDEIADILNRFTDEFGLTNEEKVQVGKFINMKLGPRKNEQAD